MQLRIADPLIGLSAIGDLGRGLELGHAARTCFIGCRLARALGADDDTIREVFYTALLQHIGCVAHAHDTAPLDRGRTVEVLEAADRTDFSRPSDVVRTFLSELTVGGDLFTRLRLLAPAARMGTVVARTSCEIAEMTARQIGLSEGVQVAVRHLNEWYNGKGGFLRRKGEDIPIASRIVLAAFTGSIFDALGGVDVALEAVRARAGRILDPAIASAFAREGPKILVDVASTNLLASLADEEPEPRVCVDHDGIDEISIAVGAAVDLKTLFTHGSALRAFDLAGSAAASLGLERTVVGQTRRAAALRDVGKASLPNAILEKAGALTDVDREHVRLHAYHTERVLARSSALASEAKLAGMHHERIDGSGYHRGSIGSAIPMGARVVAAVDVLVALTQPRPHRPARSLDEACSLVQGDTGLDRDAVAAVISAAHGSTRSPRRRSKAGLTDRQVDVLRLVAQGLSNRQIAERLVVSPRTAERHVQDIYLRIGASSRAAAALFAAEHDLL